MKADQKAQGRYLGGSKPFGFEVVDGELVRNEDEQSAISEMKRLQAAGKSLRAIAAVMKEMGHDLSHTAVQRVLRGVEG